MLPSMHELTGAEIRASFVNATKGETTRLALPPDLADLPWDDLDFLGWRDPASPQRAFIVMTTAAGATGIALRLAHSATGRRRRNMCAVCLTTHSGDGVSLMTARKAGRAGQQGNSVGTYLCSDLACSLYVRGKRDAGIGARLHETLTVQEKIDRTVANLAAFVAKVTTA